MKKHIAVLYLASNNRQSYCVSNTLFCICFPGCGEDVTLELGQTTYVDYLYYDNGMDCFWTVKAADGQQIVVTVKKFESEANYDFLSLGTGMEEQPDNPESYIIFKHSGEEPPDPAEFKVESSEIWVRFTSDDWDRKGGFQLEITDSSAKGIDKLIIVLRRMDIWSGQIGY